MKGLYPSLVRSSCSVSGCWGSCLQPCSCPREAVTHPGVLHTSPSRRARAAPPAGVRPMAASVMRRHLPAQGHHTERCSLRARRRGPVGWGRGELPRDSGLIDALPRRESPGAP